MIVLIANLGSTSFKYKLFDMHAAEDGGMPEAQVLADGASERIGAARGEWYLQAGDQVLQGSEEFADHSAAIDLHLEKLLEAGSIKDLKEIEAIGFKAVHGGSISGAVRVDKKVIETMIEFSDVAPQHNPPYIAAMRAFAKTLPRTPQVAAFETGFHQTIPRSRQVYGIPYKWTEDIAKGGLGIRRYGFHGASHRYIATRMAELMPNGQRIISCHLGGSSSVCAIDDGKSVANSFGLTVQSGTFHASRVGDFDTFAILKLLKAGIELDTIWQELGHEAGLKGLSGVSSDMREVEKAAGKGNEQAKLAIDAFVESCRHYIGAYLAALNGADALVFTGGIGQNSPLIRQEICKNLDQLGINLDGDHNKRAIGTIERRIDAGLVDAASGNGTQIWVLPTNEELIVARQTVEVLGGVKLRPKTIPVKAAKPAPPETTEVIAKPELVEPSKTPETEIQATDEDSWAPTDKDAPVTDEGDMPLKLRNEKKSTKSKWKS
jgi:acetate kinase